LTLAGKYDILKIEHSKAKSQKSTKDKIMSKITLECITDAAILPDSIEGFDIVRKIPGPVIGKVIAINNRNNKIILALECKTNTLTLQGDITDIHMPDKEGDGTYNTLFTTAKKVLDLIDAETYTAPVPPSDKWMDACNDLNAEIYG